MSRHLTFEEDNEENKLNINLTKQNSHQQYTNSWSLLERCKGWVLAGSNEFDY